jgi:hypothetical protein
MSESRPPLPPHGFMAYPGTALCFVFLVGLDREGVWDRNTEEPVMT